MDMNDPMTKIAIIGSGGCGKSTLARELGEILQLPVYHLDALHWKPGWVPTPEKEWDELMQELVAKDKWIIDGNYGRNMEIRLHAADTIIFLDYPTYIPLYRVLKRRVQYHGKSRPDMGEGCTEKIDWPFLKWIIHYRRDKRPEVLEKLNPLKASKRVLIFESPSELERFVAQLRNGIAMVT